MQNDSGKSMASSLSQYGPTVLNLLPKSVWGFQSKLEPKKLLKTSKEENKSVEPDYEYPFPTPTSEIKLEFIFGFLMKFYMKLTSIF